MRIAEMMKEHENGVLITPKDKLIVTFATRYTHRPNSKLLKQQYPDVYNEVLKTSASRKLKVEAIPN